MYTFSCTSLINTSTLALTNLQRVLACTFLIVIKWLIRPYGQESMRPTSHYCIDPDHSHSDLVIIRTKEQKNFIFVQKKNKHVST